MALRIASREFTSSGRGAGTREERSCTEGCCLAASLFEASTVSGFGAEDTDCAQETGAEMASARNATNSKDFTASSVLSRNSLSLARSARDGVYLNSPGATCRRQVLAHAAGASCGSGFLSGKGLGGWHGVGSGSG